MKKIINNVEDVVKQACHGIVLAHPDLRLDAKYKVIYRQDLHMEKVALISGGVACPPILEPVPKLVE
ncbi:MAG: hypothetical protein ACOYJB_02620 [Christensenellaceae bacterium]